MNQKSSIMISSNRPAVNSKISWSLSCVGRIGVAGDEVPAGRSLADDRCRHAARHFDAGLAEAVPRALQQFAGREVIAAESLDVDFGNARLPAPVDRRIEALFVAQVVAHVLRCEERREAMVRVGTLGQRPKIGLRCVGCTEAA